MRPESIRKFDMFYLGALALSVVNFVLGYAGAVRDAEAQMADAGVAGAGGAALAVGFVIGMAISLLLWWLVARKGVEFVKWILVLFLLFSVWSIVSGVGGAGFGIAAIIAVVVLLMQAAAIWYLFRPDAKAWFEAQG